MLLNSRLAILGSISALLGSGCLDTGSTGESGGASSGRIQLVPTVNGGKAALARVGTSGTTGLESFQVAVSNILLAKDLTTNGSGWSGLSGPLNLFSQNIGDHNAVDTAMVRDPAWSHHFFDFCDQASLSKLGTSVPFTIKDTGDYHWAVINWAPFFKVRSTIPLDGGDTLYTHDGPVTEHQFPGQSDGRYFVTEAAKSLFQGPAEDAVVRKNNGGTWFRFLKPLRLTEADLDPAATIPDTVGMDSAGKPIVNLLPSGKWNVLLVFNPKDLLYAGDKQTDNMSVVPDLTTADSAAYFHVPFLKATAVPYREGEEVIRETYEFTVDIDKAWAKGVYGMRLELYLIGENVVAVTVHSYPLDGKLAPPDVPVVFFADAKEDGSLSLQNYDRTPIFDGFARKQAVDEEGQVTWNPGSMAQDLQTLTYKLSEIRKMN